MLVWKTLLGVNNNNNNINDKCRLCGDRDETVDHVISEYGQMAQKE